MAVDEYGNEIPDDESDTELVKDLRKQVRESKNARAEADTLKRELAFLKAGIPDSKGSAYFVKGYDGELTAEAIKAAAIEAGFLEAEKPADDDITDEERAAHERAVAAAAGGGSVVPPGYEDELRAATNEEQAIAVMHKYNIKVID